ncbi:LETM1 domain-containing protein 1-like [Brachyhypopomus gauderio]|uniref:LETM1 domain-containing protein 1-like n=1 Tax=Brachyhypopomus gauderio TaxID=698409 RepID=UPI004042B1A3
MFRLCNKAVFMRGQWTNFSLRLSFPSCYSTSPVRLGILKRVNEKYERVLEQRFPRFYLLYHTLMRGFKLLFEDVKEVRRIRRNIRSKSIHYRQLPYREMERLILFRRDMIKAIPLAVISLPPFAICLVFILMWLFPQQLLFRHFWTAQQQRKFQMISHRKRSEHQAQILNNVACIAPRVSNWSQRGLLQNLCTKVQSGAHPDVSELLGVREVFSGPLLGMQSLKPSHLRSLGSQIPIIVWLPSFLVRRRLAKEALDLICLDSALDSLGLNQLTDEELQRACDLRGLYSGHLSSSQCRAWLHQWLQFSAQVKESETSLVLHSLAVFTVNYPSMRK